MKFRHYLAYAIRHYFVGLVLSCALVGFGIYGFVTFEPAASNAAFTSPADSYGQYLYLVAIVTGIFGLIWIARRSA
ncbi:hypothetical protein [Xanthomonas translucens]|uniref:hypothetical protein n=1 Tax=Xanthomonas campestris pv. translucens TaxID=343 RepID=UPI00083AFE59|nr:hypothetical protein [Xanthomonas translucens]